MSFGDRYSNRALGINKLEMEEKVNPDKARKAAEPR